MKRLLSFKHWQLFILIFICGAWTSPGLLNEIVKSVAVVTFTLWMYAIGVSGQEKILRAGLKPMNLKLFKINVIIAGIFFFLSLVFSAIYGEVDRTPWDSFEFTDLLYTTAVLYLIFAIIQTIIFTCKTIAKLEYRREVSFGDYFNNLLLMFFFFIGIWFLQPKVNKYIAKEEEEEVEYYEALAQPKPGYNSIPPAVYLR